MKASSINTPAVQALSKKDLDGLKEAGHPHYKEIEKVWQEGQKPKDETATDPAEKVKK